MATRAKKEIVLHDSVWRRYEAPGEPIGNKAHAAILIDSLERGGVGRWNRWRKRSPRVEPDLSGIVLEGRNLQRANFRNAVLHRANLASANLYRADLRGASLKGARLFRANLDEVKAARADFRDADLTSASLWRVDCTRARFDSGWTRLSGADLHLGIFEKAKMRGVQLFEANLRFSRFDGADLRGANLARAVLDGTVLFGAKLSGSDVREALIRGVHTDRRTQQKSLQVNFNSWNPKRGLVKFKSSSVDDIKVAQFYDVVAEHGAVGKLIAAGTMSVVLILGRFSPKRKRVLDSLAKALRERGKNAIVFDFPSPEKRELSDTVRFTAVLSQFIIVDLTHPSSVPLEMQAFIPDLMVPVATIIEAGARPFAMFADLQRRYSWVLPPVSYRSAERLVSHMDDAILAPIAKAARDIERRRWIALRRPRAIGR